MPRQSPPPIATTTKLISLSFAGIGAIFASTAPAKAALITCTGNADLGSIATGSGAKCGFIAPGDTFLVDVTAGIQALDPDQPVGVGVVTSGGSPFAVSNLSAVVVGQAGGLTFTFDNPAIFPVDEANLDNPFGSALGPNFSYSGSDEPMPGAGIARRADFAFGDIGVGGFSGLKASPNELQPFDVDFFGIAGRLESVDDNLISNIISVGYAGPDKPSEGTTFGGFFTTQVPGPLPIAGAGAALAWTRELRRKQRLAAMSSAGKSV